MRQPNESISAFLSRNGWPLDKEIILVTGGFGEVWLFAQLFSEIAKQAYRVFVVTASVRKILCLFVDEESILNRLIVVNEEEVISKIEAFLVRYSPTYAQQYFHGKQFLADIRCSSLVHYPYLCRAVQARALEYHEALKVVFDIASGVELQQPNTKPMDPIARQLLAKSSTDGRPVCLLFCVNITHESLDLVTISELVNQIESDLHMNVLLNVTLKANANRHGLGRASELVQQIKQSDLAHKCLEIEGQLLPSVSKLISLAVGCNGGGMDVIRLFGTADAIYIETPHRWEANVESNAGRTDGYDPFGPNQNQRQGVLKRHKNFPSGPRGVLSYTPPTERIMPNDVQDLLSQYKNFVSKRKKLG